MKSIITLIAIMVLSFNLLAQNSTHLGIGLGNLTKTIAYETQYEPSETRTGIDFQLRHQRAKPIVYYFEYSYLRYKTKYQFSHNDYTYQPKIKVLGILNKGKLSSHELGGSFAFAYHELNRTFKQGDLYGNLFEKTISAEFPIYTLGINYHYVLSYKKFKLLIGSELGKVLNSSIISKYDELQGLGIQGFNSGLYFNMDLELYFKLK